jgi:hypothetical protein
MSLTAGAPHRVRAGEPLVRLDPVQAGLATVLAAVSLVGLLLHMLVYSWLKRLRTQPAQILLSLVCALFFGQLIFFFGIEFTGSRTICIFLGSLCHYFLLAAFLCLGVMGLDLCRTGLSAGPGRAPSRRRFKLYSYYSWGLPFLVILVGHALDNLER